MPFSNRRILLGITGSIAAYKSAILLRLLVKGGAEVQVIQTEAARDFIGPLTLATLSGKPVLSEMHLDDQWANHVALGHWADALLIAPASANTLGKMAHGLVDNLLTAVYLSAKCPTLVAPAMDADMWDHPATQDNLSILSRHGVVVLPVGEGPLASGLEGPGRLAEPEHIVEELQAFFQRDTSLAKKKILITAGPTHEAIDPVRFIGNHSSGKMGIRLAEEALRNGYEVVLVLGPSSEPTPVSNRLNLVRVTSALEMQEAVRQHLHATDIFILAAAVADFRPDVPAAQKIKKEGRQSLALNLVANPDLAAWIGNNKKPHQFLCGFALETENLVENARAKMDKKNMDLIVINSPNDAQSAFGYDTNKIAILDKSGKLISFERQSKNDAARAILQAIAERL
ncbi:MAG: bifunctional phosphopantothenoylcysteine decarboxylase/phosphopantothenate--cysteine ligase CoaBC [Saprospiraceae bacterium]|nr:bifunctional phosphopantothenoylcysteine decarboxylase/phosphopantothenate--cysteine ligase CoaBC [Saprospiraceae bacterium]